METVAKYQARIYKYSEVCYFRKTKELNGGLSNMASGFPIRLNGICMLTSEALYQACRFPHLPEVQKKIIDEKSPMTAKMVGKPFRIDTRKDWDSKRVDIMYWCLRVKLAQNFITFGQLLESTCDKAIVEDSNKDAFWGAVKDKKDKTILVGVNALGRLLMKLRQEYNSANRYDLLFVEPLPIPDFSLYGAQIQTVDERQSFINNLQKHWILKPKHQLIKEHISFKPELPYLDVSKNQITLSIVSEPEIKKVKPKKTQTRKTKSASTTNLSSGDLFANI
jgi:ribA/ribD-fused uncharacterized protein